MLVCLCCIVYFHEDEDSAKIQIRLSVILIRPNAIAPSIIQFSSYPLISSKFQHQKLSVDKKVVIRLIRAQYPNSPGHSSFSEYNSSLGSKKSYGIVFIVNFLPHVFNIRLGKLTV